MTQRIALSPQLRTLIEYTESSLGIEIILHRHADAPPSGILLDTYTYQTEKDVIAYSASLIGLLKDFVIALNVVRLLLRGTASKAGKYRVLSYEPEGVARGMGQIYLDILKDERTRSLPLVQKQRLPFYLYKLFHETLSDIPLEVMGHAFLATNIPAMRSAQLYYLVKESLRDMHELVEVKNFIPRRYFVMHNGMFYARDLFLAQIMSEYKLNPLINIPELQRFKNLDAKEMMTHRWSQSHWYYTKVVGDAMYASLTRSLPPYRPEYWNPARVLQLYENACVVANNFMALMQVSDWYTWASPDHLRSADEHQEEIEQVAASLVFGV